MGDNKKETGTVYWITGLSGSGKTTIGIKLYDYIKSVKETVVRLDGDILREVFNNKDYSIEGRKNISFQYSRLSKMISDQGIDVVICVISMFDDVRKWNRDNIQNYREIYLEVEMEELIRRNQKGLYENAINNNGEHVYGINMELQLPKEPDLVIRNYGEISPDKAFEELRYYLFGFHG